MICPKCNLAMKSGFLQSSGSRGGSIMFWATEKRKLRMRLDKGDVQIANKAIGGSSFPAWICPACQLVLFSFEKDKEQI